MARLEREGLKGEEVVVLTPYTAQVSLLHRLLGEGGVEVATVDSFQGREQDVVLLPIGYIRGVELVPPGKEDLLLHTVLLIQSHESVEEAGAPALLQRVEGEKLKSGAGLDQGL